MQNFKDHVKSNPLSLTYTEKDIKRITEQASGDMRRMLTFMHEERGNSCTLGDLSATMARHSVRGEGFTALFDYAKSNRLIHVQENGLIVLTENAKAVLSRINSGRVIR